MMPSSSADESVEAFLRLAARMLGVDAAFIALCSENAMRFISAYGMAHFQPFLVMGTTYTQWRKVLTVQGGLFVDDLRVRPGLSETPLNDLHHLVGFASMPIIEAGDLIGMLYVAHGERVDWTEAQKDALDDLATVACGLRALSNRALPVALGLDDPQSRILERLESELNEVLDLESLLTFLMDAALRATYSRDGFIALADGPQLLKICRVIGDHYQIGPLPFEPGVGMIGRVIQQRYAEFSTGDRLRHDPLLFASRTQVAHTLPIVYRDQLLGVVHLETPDAARFTSDAFGFLILLIDRVALAIDHARAHQTVRDQMTELKKLYDQVKGLEQMKSTLLDLAAHDLRNPIGSVGSLVRLLMDDPPPSEEQRHTILTTIAAAIEDSSRIIADLMTLQRVENGGHEALFRLVNLNAIVRAVVVQKEGEVEAHGQTLVLDLPDTPLKMSGEPALLREALRNLLDNAIKYTSPGGTVTIATWREAAADQLVLTITDTGVGIHANARPFVFDPFYRAPTEIARGIPGSGLGLHIVRQIVEQHSGTIALESEVGIGTTFTVRLPALPR